REGDQARTWRRCADRGVGQGLDARLGTVPSRRGRRPRDRRIALLRLRARARADPPRRVAERHRMGPCEAAAAKDCDACGYFVPNVAMRMMMRIDTAKIGSARSAYTRCSS